MFLRMKVTTPEGLVIKDSVWPKVTSNVLNRLNGQLPELNGQVFYNLKKKNHATCILRDGVKIEYRLYKDDPRKLVEVDYEKELKLTPEEIKACESMPHAELQAFVDKKCEELGIERIEMANHDESLLGDPKTAPEHDGIIMGPDSKTTVETAAALAAVKDEQKLILL